MTTSYRGGLPPDSVTPDLPVHVRFLEPSGVELAVYLDKFPRLGDALKEKENLSSAEFVMNILSVVLDQITFKGPTGPS